MTPEQQRIAIAEACGWTCEPDGWWHKAGVHIHGIIPDYPNDLNAMHEAEKLFKTQRDWDKYLFSIRYNSSTPLLPAYFKDADCVHATASQRAEAFLRTIGKWKE